MDHLVLWGSTGDVSKRLTSMYVHFLVAEAKKGRITREKLRPIVRGMSSCLVIEVEQEPVAIPVIWVFLQGGSG